MKSKTYTQSKRPLDKNQSSKFCQSGVKQTHFQNLKEKRKWFFDHRGTLNLWRFFNFYFSVIGPIITLFPRYVILLTSTLIIWANTETLWFKVFNKLGVITESALHKQGIVSRKGFFLMGIPTSVWGIQRGLKVQPDFLKLSQSEKVIT